MIVQQNWSKWYPDTVEESQPDMPILRGRNLNMDNDYAADYIHELETRGPLIGAIIQNKMKSVGLQRQYFLMSNYLV